MFEQIKAGDQVRARGNNFDIVGTVKSIVRNQAIIEWSYRGQSGFFRSVHLNHVRKIG